MTMVYQKKPLASGLGLMSLLIQEYSQYMSCYHKIQLVKYHCCCSSLTKGLDLKKKSTRKLIWLSLPTYNVYFKPYKCIKVYVDLKD